MVKTKTIWQRCMWSIFRAYKRKWKWG